MLNTSRVSRSVSKASCILHARCYLLQDIRFGVFNFTENKPALTHRHKKMQNIRAHLGRDTGSSQSTLQLVSGYKSVFLCTSSDSAATHDLTMYTSYTHPDESWRSRALINAPRCRDITPLMHTHVYSTVSVPVQRHRDVNTAGKTDWDIWMHIQTLLVARMTW